MPNRDNKIDELFNDGLANFEVSPPPVVWDKISATMGYRKRKVRALWWWTMSGAASLIIALVAGWYLSNMNNDYDELFAEMKILKHTQLERIVLETPIKTDVHIHFDKSEFKRFNTLIINDNKTETEYQSRHLVHSNETVIESNEIIVLNLMNTKAAELHHSNNISFELIQNENRIDEMDKEIIEANFLAMNTESEVSFEKGKWLMGVQASPVYRFEQNNGGGKLYSSGENAVDNSVSTNYAPNMAGGLSVSYETGKKLAFITGVNYNEVSQNSGEKGLAFSGFNWFRTKDYLDFSPENESVETAVVYTPDNVVLNTNVGLANINIPEGTKVAYASQLGDSYNAVAEVYDYEQAAAYLEIPFLLKYKLIEERFGIHLLGGVNANILLSNRVDLLDRGEVIASGNIESLSPITYSTSLGMGMNYKISERFEINIDPMLKIQLSSLNTQSNFNARPYAFGVFSGITYQF